MSPTGIHLITELLGLRPRTAEDLSEASGLTLEDTYRCLVWLNDRKAARMSKNRHANKITGWLQGLAA